MELSKEEASTTSGGYKKQPPVERQVKLRKNKSMGRSAQSLTNSLMKPVIDIDVEEIKDKLEAGGDPNGHPENSGRWRPIFWAAISGNFEILSTLLSDTRLIVDVTDSEGNTALHHAVTSACRKGDKYGRFYQCIDVLMSYNQIKLNIPNKKGYTAIGLAVNYLRKTCVEQMLKHPSAQLLYLDYCLSDSESSVREIICKRFPELQTILPSPLRENLASSDRNTKLFAALQHNKYSIFRDNLDSTDPNPWYDEPYHTTLLETACQTKNREEFVKLLLHSGADPNIKHRVTGMPLLHATAMSGNLEVVEILLKQDNINVRMTDNDDRTILHWLARVSGSRPGDKQRLEICFELLLRPESRLKVDIDDLDESGNTALHYAVECEFRDRVMLLLNYGADIMISKHGSPLLSSISSSVLEDIFDECLESNNEPVTSKNCMLTFRYEILATMFPYLAECSNLRDLLRHPVITSFVSLKWRQVKLVFFLDVAFYVAFVLFLSVYILFSESDYTSRNEGDVNSTNNVPTFPNKSSLMIFGMNDGNFTSDSTYRRTLKYAMGDSSPEYLWYPLIVLLVLLGLREIFQLVIYRRVYILTAENWLELLLISATLISCSGVVQSMEVKLHLSAVAIFCGWLELALLSGRLPQLSVQLEMLKKVSRTFLKFMTSYILLLIAFALSFYILFKGSLELDGVNMFANPILSVLKTIVMFTGELEASNLNFDNFPYTSYGIFLLFILLITIVLLNLLNGLAVNDTEMIIRDAETLSIVARVRIISRIETMQQKFQTFMTPKELTDKIFVLYPNRPNPIEPNIVQSALGIIRKRRESTKSQNVWSDLADKLSALHLRQGELEKKFEATFEETQHILRQILNRLQSEDETSHTEI